MEGVKMSDPWLRALQAGEHPIDYSDTVARGLLLRVEVSGRKTWCVRYVFEGQRRRYRIGAYPEVKLAKARERAEKIRGSAALGTDAQGERSKVRLGETVREVSKAWLKSEDTRRWRPRSREGFEAELRLRLLPDLGSMKLSEVTRADVQVILDDVEGVHTRNRALAVARMLFNWAVKRELLTVSPCANIDKLREPKRTRTYTDEELRQITTAFDRTSLAGFVRLLLLTGVRREEALSARRADMDLERGLWTIPPELEKTGDQRSEARRVVLSDAAVKVLTVQKERNLARGLASSPYVFPNPKGGRLDRSAPKPIVYTLMGRRRDGRPASTHKLAKPRPRLIPEDFRLHDIRRTVADRMLNDLGLSAYIVDVGVLGHSKPRLLGTYAPSVPQKELKAAMNTWAEEFERIVNEAAATAAAR